MKQLEPVFADILQNAIDAIETATPAPAQKQYHEPPMMTAHFFMNEFQAAQSAIYQLIEIKRKEATEAREQSEKYATGSGQYDHYVMIERLKWQDIAHLRMASSAFYHATKRENRPR